MNARWILPLATTLFFACSATSTIRDETYPFAGSLESFSANIDVENRCGKPDEQIDPIRAELENALTAGLTEAGVFRELSSGGGQAVLDVDLTQVHRVSEGARLWAGAMAGKNHLVATVSVRNASGEALRTCTIETTSASHPWGADKMSDAIAAFVGSVVEFLQHDDATSN